MPGPEDRRADGNGPAPAALAASASRSPFLSSAPTASGAGRVARLRGGPGPSPPPDGRARRFRRSCLTAGAYLALLPGAILLFAPTSLDLSYAYEIWGISAFLGGVLILCGLTVRPSPGAADRPFYVP